MFQGIEDAKVITTERFLERDNQLARDRGMPVFANDAVPEEGVNREGDFYRKNLKGYKDSRDPARYSEDELANKVKLHGGEATRQLRESAQYPVGSRDANSRLFHSQQDTLLMKAYAKALQEMKEKKVIQAAATLPPPLSIVPPVDTNLSAVIQATATLPPAPSRSYDEIFQGIENARISSNVFHADNMRESGIANIDYANSSEMEFRGVAQQLMDDPIPERFSQEEIADRINRHREQVVMQENNIRKDPESQSNREGHANSKMMLAAYEKALEELKQKKAEEDSSAKGTPDSAQLGGNIEINVAGTVNVEANSEEIKKQVAVIIAPLQEALNKLQGSFVNFRDGRPNPPTATAIA